MSKRARGVKKGVHNIAFCVRYAFGRTLHSGAFFLCSLFAVIVYSRSVDLWSMGVWVKCIWSMDVLCTVCECFLTHLQFIDGAVGHSMAPWPLFWGLSAVMCIPGQWICSLWVSGWSLFGPMEVLCTVCECFWTHLQFIGGAVNCSVALDRKTTKYTGAVI